MKVSFDRSTTGMKPKVIERLFVIEIHTSQTLITFSHLFKVTI